MRAGGREPMRVEDIDLNLLKIFHAVYLERSVSRAALRLRLTQPSVSHGLGRLRHLFGDALFVRSAGGVAPTALAGRLAASVDEVLRIVQGMLSEGIVFPATTSQRTFRLHMSDFGEIAFLPTLMGELRRRAPSVGIETQQMRETDLGGALEARSLDFALGYLPGVGGHFEREELLAERYVLLMRGARAAQLRLRHGCELDLRSELPEDAEFIAVTSHPYTRIFLEQAGVGARLRVAVPNFMAVPAILNRCDYAVLLPRTVARSFSNYGDFASFEVRHCEPCPVNLYWHRRSNNDPGHRWLRTVLIDLFRIGTLEPYESWLAESA